MARAWAVLKMGLRAAVWKATPNPPTTGLAALIFWFGAMVAVAAYGDYLAASNPAEFVIYGLSALMGWIVVFLVITACFVQPESRTTALVAMLSVTIVAALVGVTIQLLPTDAIGELPKPILWTSIDTRYLVFVVHLIWWLGAVLAIFRSVEPERRAGRFVRSLCLWGALMVAWVVFPHRPVFEGRDFDLRTANWWEYIVAVREGGFNEEESRRPSVPAARVELRQPALLEKASEALAPQRPGIVDIYTIGVAPWADQDVFVKELDGALDSMARVLPIENRVLRLVNHPDTVLTTPLATRQNFAAAVHSIARTMDKDEDILLLFLTSHGSPLGVGLRFSGLVHGSLSPEHVASVLDQEGIKNRVLIVSACYSGVFAHPLLTNDNTIVMTAADEKSPSFGCSNEREWTYFGDAFFNRGLKSGADLEHAFNVAKKTIAEWEAREGLPVSNPQGHFGTALMQRVAPLYRSPANADTQALPQVRASEN